MLHIALEIEINCLQGIKLKKYSLFQVIIRWCFMKKVGEEINF